MTHNDASTTAERAALGATLLDVVRPGWAAEINLDGLQMVATTSCILGQLYGSFESGLEDLHGGLDWDWAAETGFHNRVPGFWEDAAHVWENLQAAWVAEVEARVS